MFQKFTLFFIVVLFSKFAFGQNGFQAVVKDAETQAPIFGVSVIVLNTTIGSISDKEGRLTLNTVPDGKQHLEFSYLGYEKQVLELDFPLSDPGPIIIFLSPQSDNLDAVLISSTRSTRTIRNIPTRVEFIAGEELEEKGNMRPGDIRMLLNESTGIITQTTSPVSNNAAIRIQGLDGRYTQILKDGLPLYSGAASGLGLLQIPPLDLKQVEVIKGSSSTLYGGGAIAGLVNLISKTPHKEKELNFHLDANSGKGFDLNGFYSKRNDKIGTTIFASHNRSWAYDPADINLSAIPQFERYVLNPKIFLYFDDDTELHLGVNTTLENRLGGNMDYINGKNEAGYFERNKTQRYSTQLQFDHRFDEKSSLQLKNSFSYFNREISIPNYRFDGIQNASFSELNYNHHDFNLEWVAGLNLWTESFREKKKDILSRRDYQQHTLGGFVQNNWRATDWLHLETGLRTDYVFDYGFVFLPRISTLFKFTNQFTSRIGGGFGYKAPTLFTEESERIAYRNVDPIDKKTNKLEKSYGANIDFNYHTEIVNAVEFSLNHLFFYTHLKHPLVMEEQANDHYRFINSGGYVTTKGMETNVKLEYEDFELYLGYTYTDTRLHENKQVKRMPLTAKNRINTVLMYEVEGKWMVGLEAYYYSKQNLSDGSTGKPYWLNGLMIEKLWDKFSLYINFENFLDVRQTRFDNNIYNGSITQPEFKEIYAPLEGLVINGGIKIFL